jgi:ferredoxin
MVKINDTCIGCGMCGMTAPTIFKVEGVPATVIKQPETPEENTQVEQAIESCPTKAISK